MKRVAILLLAFGCSSDHSGHPVDAPGGDAPPVEIDAAMVDAAPPVPRQLALAAIGQRSSLRVYAATPTSFRKVVDKTDPLGWGTGIAWTDYDGDGLDDVVSMFGPPSTPGGNELLVLHNDGASGLAEAGTRPSAIGLLEGYDADADGDGDIYVGIDGGSDLAFRSDGTALPQFPSWGEPGNSAWEAGIATGDMTGDGRPEVVMARGSYGDAMSRGTLGAPSPTWSRPASGSTESSDVAMIDLDLDGRLDAAFSRSDSAGTTGSIEVLEWDGTTLVPLWSTTQFGGVRKLDWADMDGDGVVDLAICDGGSHLRIFERQGSNFVANAINQLDAPCSQLTWGDYDADGDPDLAVVGDGVTIYNNASAAFTSVFHDATATTAIDWGACGDGSAACFSQATSL